MVSSESVATVAAALAVALALLAGAVAGGATPLHSQGGVDDATPQHDLDCDDDPPPWANDDDDDEEDEEDEKDEEDEEDEEDEDDCEDEEATTATSTTSTTERTTSEWTESSTTRDSEPTTAPVTTAPETTADTATTTAATSEERSATTAARTDDSSESGAASGAATSAVPTPTDVPRDRSTTTGSASFSVAGAELSVSQVTRGAAVFVSAEVRNEGDGAGEFDAELVVDGEVRATHVVSLASGERTTVRFRLALADPGEHDVAVNDADAGALAVVVDDPASDADAGPVEVTSASVAADWVKAGHETVVEAVVRNPSNEPVNRIVRVTVDGAVVARHSVVLAPGEETEITVPFEAVDGTVAVDGVPAGDLSVSESLGAVDATTHVPDERGDGGVGVGLALVGTVGLAVLAGLAVATRRGT